MKLLYTGGLHITQVKTKCMQQQSMPFALFQGQFFTCNVESGPC